MVAATSEALRDCWGNPGSRHAYGQRAQRAFARAQAQVAALIGAEADEIRFTSGGTESNNLALRGPSWQPGDRFVSSVVEHPATLEPLRALERSGAVVDLLQVDAQGRAVLPRTLPDDTHLVSLMLAQNEVGTMQPVADAARLALPVALRRFARGQAREHCVSLSLWR